MNFNISKINTKDLNELKEFNSFLSTKAFINGYYFKFKKVIYKYI